MAIQNWIRYSPLFLVTGLVFTGQPAEAQTPQTPQSQQQAPGVTQTAPQPSTAAYPGESLYDRSMRLGYAASQAGNPATALIYFRNALYARPNDRLATIAYWNMVDLMEQGATAAQPTPATETTEPRTVYDRYMRIGYNATDRGNYQTALINFRRALEERPNDPYATQAIRNVTTYINRNTLPNAQY